MENKILNLDSIPQYCEMLGLESNNQMVAVVNLDKSKMIKEQLLRFGFYAVFLKDAMCGELRYGRNCYDYKEGTLVCFAPGQVVGFKNSDVKIKPSGMALLFHPDFIHGSTLGKNMNKYSFFSYDVHEALHISLEERKVITDCLNKIELEIEQNGDKHTKKIISSNIELFLDYCVRYYERQFDSREVLNIDLLSRFESVLNGYFENEVAEREGLPSVSYIADQMHLSANYLGDLIKKETGISAQEHVKQKLIDEAKELVFNRQLSISEIAYKLGFKYPQHFTRVFKKRVGMSPLEYRQH